MTISYPLFRSKFKKSIAESIYNEVQNKTSRYYHFLGKENLWSDFLSPFIPSSPTDVPGQPQNNFRYELHVRRDILTTKLIKPSDVSYIARRYDWNYGETYDMYDDAITVDDPAYSGATLLEDAKFYVVTNQFNVYKCLSNNYNSPSTVMPAGISTDTFTTADGYKWKFMYTIPIGLRNKFLSSQYIPVATALKTQFYSGGEIVEIDIENGGSGYSAGTIATIEGNGYIAENPYVFTNLVITKPGHGYAAAPSVLISDPTAVSPNMITAEVTTTINGTGAVNGVIFSTHGYGYDNNPTVTVEEPVAGAIAWEASTPVALNDILKNDGIYYTVTTAGTTGTTPPSHTSGVEPNGDAALTYLAEIAVLTPDMTKTEIGLSLVIDNGEIIGVTPDIGSIGYTYGTITVADSGPVPGTGAILIPNFDVGNVNTLQANVELQAVPGTIEFIKVVDGGTNYTTATVNIIGDGQNATAVPEIIGGVISKINITNPGSGYTWTDVQVISNNGAGATARAIMSPLRGHGKDAIDELNANSIAFYSAFTRDINQEIVVNNDYRKAGLLKNIRKFGSTERYTKDVGSGCIKITGIFDSSKLAHDMLLVNSINEYKNYRIVEFTDTQILLSVFNNFSININDILKTPNNDQIQVTEVAERTIDQFSGELLFLTVREKFQPTSEQLVTVKTIITI